MTSTPRKIARRSVLAGMVALGGCAWEPETVVVLSTTAVRLPLVDLEQHFAAERFLHVPEARCWVVPVRDEAAAALAGADDVAMQAAARAGYLALHQKCPHLGCRVPSCATSGLFECPCHASQFTRFGEWLAGPAPRGLDRIPTSIDGSDLVIERGQRIPGTEQGFHPSGETAVGPSCIGV